MDDKLHARLLAVFRDEALEILDGLTVTVARSLGDAAQEGARQSDEVAAAMRLAHNLKGAASSVGLEAVARLAHAIEDALLQPADSDPTSRRRLTEAVTGAITAIHDALADGRSMETLQEAESRLRSVMGAAVDPRPAVLAAEAPAGADAGDRRRPATVRVEAARLDRLIAMARELLVAEARHREGKAELDAFHESLVEATRREGALRLAAKELVVAHDRLTMAHAHRVVEFSRLATELHAAMKDLRMTPLDALVPAAHRAVAETASQLGKSVALEASVGSVEIDRVVLEGLRDPLMHLLRNAVDHGIEGPEERDLCGKAERGVVAITAEPVGSTVRIDVADDGRGIDVARVLAVARDRGLVEPDGGANLSHEEVARLLFSQGFSTAGRANMVSGRGVGLDVVHRAVRALGGTLEVVPRGPLGGALFRLVLPVSVLSTRGFLVRANETRSMLPVRVVERAVRVPSTAVTRLDGEPAAIVDGLGPVRLRWLADVVGGRAAREPRFLCVLVVRQPGKRLGLVVDEIVDEGDFVVQPLPWNLGRVHGVAGVIVLPDAAVALSLEVGALLEAEVTAAAARPVAPQSGGAARILVADDSLTTRTLHRNLLVQAGYVVVVAADGAEAWEALRGQPIDLVVTDVQMPNVDGFELTRRIREDGRLRNVPVILVTSLATTDQVERGLKAGADEYVVKGPLEREALLAAVARQV
jgi:two-component system chemotaxis sensor kinase CheA